MKCRLSESQNAEIPSLSRTHFPKDVSAALTFFTLDIMSSYYLSCIPEEGGEPAGICRNARVFGVWGWHTDREVEMFCFSGADTV